MMLMHGFYQGSVQKGVEVTRADGSLLTPYDLKRLQVDHPPTFTHQSSTYLSSYHPASLLLLPMLKVGGISAVCEMHMQQHELLSRPQYKYLQRNRMLPLNQHPAS